MLQHIAHRTPRPPRLHLRLAAAAFGLSGLGAALLTAPPAQPATFGSAPVVVTDLSHGRPGADIATPPATAAVPSGPSSALWPERFLGFTTRH